MGTVQIDKLKISVLMSVHYENNRYLKSCIDSILSQTHANFEFIIVADGTSEANLAVLRDYKESDDRIKLLINEKNIGLTKSLNLAFKSSSGLYIARIDSDDTSHKKRFEKQLSFLAQNPDYSLCGTKSYELIDGHETPQHTDFHQTNEDIQNALFYMNPFTHSTLMIRADHMSAVDGYNQDFVYAQDYDLVHRILTRGKAYNLPIYLVSRSMDADRISTKKQKEQLYYSVITRFNLLKTRGSTFNKVRCLYSIIRSGVKFLYLSSLKRWG